MSRLRAALSCLGPLGTGLVAETNKYFDVAKCGIGSKVAAESKVHTVDLTGCAVGKGGDDRTGGKGAYPTFGRRPDYVSYGAASAASIAAPAGLHMTS